MKLPVSECTGLPMTHLGEIPGTSLVYHHLLSHTLWCSRINGANWHPRELCMREHNFRAHEVDRAESQECNPGVPAKDTEPAEVFKMLGMGHFCSENDVLFLECRNG